MKTDFKPFDRVLVRDRDDQEWKCNIFSHTITTDYVPIFACVGGKWLRCIPYEGNEHLVGAL